MKVIFLDIDGTLVNYETQIPVSAMEAVQATRKKGNKVYLSTGRSKAEVYSHLWDIGLDGMIGGNGMYIEDNGEVLQDLMMEKQDVIKTVDWMQEQGIAFYLESKNGLFACEHFLEKTTEKLWGEASKENQERLQAIYPDMIYGGDLYRDDVAKISFCLHPDKLAEAKATFGDHLKVDTWSATGEKPEFGEFAILGSDKVHAVDQLLNHLQVGKEHTFAFGDAASDKQMIEYCQVGIAMGNAQPNLKAAADYVTNHVDADGLWKAFERYELV
ncbi:Cof-type HAD-IIB family hydrolase [Gracilibacillus timonensis]|uniref:Cof-type HAD-IIB family hydrolase n=1 Tax=Gracilibacillus timonensis TaxID=1816696 RepID=UPI0008245F69|nr:Cof-type HAD-IIB family hydrolase [Gracilibacillus timonensis]